MHLHPIPPWSSSHKGPVSNFCRSRCLAAGQLFQLVSTVPLQMINKIGTPHIHIPLHYVCQEKTIVVLIVTTWQAGDSIPRIIVREDTKLDFGDDVTIILCHHHFQREIGEISTFNKTHKVKILSWAKTDALCFLLSTRDVGRSILFAAHPSIVCAAENLKSKGLLSAAMDDALDAL